MGGLGTFGVFKTRKPKKKKKTRGRAKNIFLYRKDAQKKAKTSR
jgi:hypothetical protein